MQLAPAVIRTELARGARRFRSAEPSHLAVVINKGVGDARVATLGLALLARLLLDRDAVLTSDCAQALEVHRARVEKSLIDTISKELSPRVLRELVHREPFGVLTRT